MVTLSLILLLMNLFITVLLLYWSGLVSINIDMHLMDGDTPTPDVYIFYLSCSCLDV